jgi:hypothetical protein
MLPPKMPNVCFCPDEKYSRRPLIGSLGAMEKVIPLTE